MLSNITPLLLTLNEASNVNRCLSQLSWASDIVVVDSGSTDDTAMRVAAVPQARLLTRRFDNHAAQWSFGLNETGIATDWVLALDADYMLSDGLIDELAALEPGNCGAFAACFRYAIDGRTLRGSLYPPVTVLFRRHIARYQQVGHTQRLQVDGEVGQLKHPIIHDDRKPLRRWLSSQVGYAALEADRAATGVRGWVHRQPLLAPWFAFAYALFGKGAIFDGDAGKRYALERLTAEAAIGMARLRGQRR